MLAGDTTSRRPMRNDAGSGRASDTDASATSRIGTAGDSCGRPKRISQPWRAGSADGATWVSTGYHPLVSSQTVTMSSAKNGRHVPPSDRNGKSGPAREKGIRTSTVSCPSTSASPSTCTPSTDPSVASGTMRSAGSGGADEYGTFEIVVSAEQSTGPTVPRQPLGPDRYVAGMFWT